MQLPRVVGGRDELRGGAVKSYEGREPRDEVFLCGFSLCFFLSSICMVFIGFKGKFWRKFRWEWE